MPAGGETRLAMRSGALDNKRSERETGRTIKGDERIVIHKQDLEEFSSCLETVRVVSFLSV